MTIYEIFSLLGGIGLFLFGMTTMSSGLRNAAGDNLQTILEKATQNKIIAVFVGLGMTILIQSSSATDVMVIGFVNAGMMNLAQAIGVIMGANIGTTVTAQITAFNLSAYAPLILFLGAVMYMFMKKHLVKHVGEVIMGFGMLFVGIAIMKEAIMPLSQSQGFINLMDGLDNALFALLFGIAFTALLQSSSSAIVIFQTFAIQGLINYHMAVYLIIGAAIGSVTPNILASLTTNRNGKRTALLNLTFNLIRAVILLALITAFPQFLEFIQSLSPNDVGRQIANTHTIFAIIAVLVELPFTNQIIKLVEKIIPVQESESEQLEERKLKFMMNTDQMPSNIAFDQAHREVVRMGRIGAKNLRHALECFFDYDEAKAESVLAREETINILNATIGDAISNLRSHNWDSKHMHDLSQMAIAVTDIERLSDHAENIIEYTTRMRNRKTSFTDAAEKEIRLMAADALKEVDLSLDIFESEDYSRLEDLEAIEARVDEQENTLINNHIARLMNNDCEPLAGVIFTDLVTDLERCADHAVNLAYTLKDR